MREGEQSSREQMGILGEVSLNRNSTCYPDFGLWRCDIPDSSGVIQSMYIYIGSSGTGTKQTGELPLYGRQ